MKRWLSIKRAVLGCLAVISLGSTTALADETLNDLAGRIEYAFYSADGRSLLQSWQLLEKLQPTSADKELHDSYVNYGRWKLAQLFATNAPDRAQQWAQTCAESKLSSKNTTLLATHQALVAACLGMLEELRPVRRLLYKNDREVAISQALQTAASSAQVRFIAGWLLTKQDAANTGYATLLQALQRFAATPTTQSTNPGWGYAETCYLLGKAEIARGNALAARNTLEQALVLAPDYRDAQQLLPSLQLK